MKKTIAIFLLISTFAFGQMTDQSTSRFSADTLSLPIQLGIGFCLTEIYLGADFKGGNISLYAGDNNDTTNFIKTYYEEEVLTYSVSEVPCRIEISPPKVTGVRNWKIDSDSTETCTFGWKAIFLNN